MRSSLLRGEQQEQARFSRRTRMNQFPSEPQTNFEFHGPSLHLPPHGNQPPSKTAYR